MNIFNKVTLQSMKKSRTRTVVTIIGVVLSAAMITGVATFGVSLLNYMANGEAEKFGGWHVMFEDVDSSFAAKQASCDKVASTAAVENIGYAKLDGGKNPSKPYLFITGYNENAFHTLPLTVLSGRLPKNSGEILVSGSVITKGGVHYNVGDTLTLAVGSRMNGGQSLGQHIPFLSGKETLRTKTERTYTVVGICQTPRYEEDSAPGYTAITTADVESAADDLSLFVTLKNPREVHSYANNTAGNHAVVLNNSMLRFMGLSDDPGDAVFNAFLYSAGGIVILIVMIGSIFLIYNSFNISLNERTHQFGILSSVGATAKQLRHSVLFEGLCIGAIGIPIGILTGIGMTGLVIRVVSQNFASILFAGVPLTLTISAPAILAAVVASMITILISADIPARKAANVPVMECIRQTNEVKVEANAVKISTLARNLYGLEGTLALKNFKRNKKRYRSIVLSLVLSVVLFVSTSSMVADLKQASGRAVVFTTYDIGIATPDMNDTKMVQLYDKLKTADGVTESSYQALMKFSCTANASDLSDDYWKFVGTSSDKTVQLPMNIQFLDDSSYRKILKEVNLPEKEYTGPNAKLIALAKMRENNNPVDKVDQVKNLFTGSSMNFSIAPEANGKSKTEQSQSVSITFVNAILPDSLPVLSNSGSKQPFTFEVVAPYSLKEKFETPDNPVVVKGLTFRSKNPSQSVAEMKSMIQAAGITTAEYNLYNNNDLMDESRNYIFIANVFSYTFILIISLIAVANVFNTISTNIKLRRRELAMLRSVGMSEHSFQKMMNFECAFYGMKALIIGLPTAAAASLLIHLGMAPDVNFMFPWASMAISVFSVLFVVFITMLYAVSKIKKENIIDALRDDMD